MFNVTQYFKEECSHCPELEPHMDVTKSYANGKPYVTEITLTCQHRNLCDALAQVHDHYKLSSDLKTLELTTEKKESNDGKL